MTTRRMFRALALGAAIPASVLVAQEPADTAACRQLLAAPMADSVSVRIGMHASSMDRDVPLPSDYAATLADGIRGYLRFTAPLQLGVYGRVERRAITVDTATHTVREKWFQDTALVTVTPTLAGAYAMTVYPDGHMTDARVVGGTHTDAFDTAFLGALKTLSDSSLLPPYPDSREKPAEKVQLHLALQPMDLGGLLFDERVGLPLVPLFSMRGPAFRGSSDVQPLRTWTGPQYPVDARARRIEGNVLMQFVVRPTQDVDVASIEILHSTGAEFSESVLKFLRSLSAAPYRYKGCPLPSLVQMPFEFTLLP